MVKNAVVPDTADAKNQNPSPSSPPVSGAEVIDAGPCFELERADGVAILTLSRPGELNTMTADFWRDLPRVVRELDQSGTTRVLVIESTGKHFSAGMDLSVFTGGGGLGGQASFVDAGRKNARLMMLVELLQATFSALEQARFPVLTAIQGGCIGGAVDMVCAADCRYATEDAFFCIQEINLGMTADVGTLQRLPKLVPDGVARQWAYTGERVPASRAAEVGLVNEVFGSHDEMRAAVREIAATIAAKAPLAIWGTKEMLRFARDHSVPESLRHMALWQSGMFQGTDMMVEFAARAESKSPEFEANPDMPSHL